MKALRPFQRTFTSPHRPLQPSPLSNLTPLSSRRTFLPNPFSNDPSPFGESAPQTLHASRTLPYPVPAIYNIISDVSSYSTFLPYCQQSVVTKWSRPDALTNTRWPSEAKLVVGWGNITEEWVSRVFCVPGKIVEAVGSGDGSQLNEEDIAHHLEEGENVGPRGGGGNDGNALLTRLSTRWDVRPVEGRSRGEGNEATEVNLSIEFAFANPIYSALTAGAAPKVAELMIRAFEERVRVVMDKS